MAADMSLSRTTLAGFALAAAVIAADQSSKWWILNVVDLPTRDEVAVLEPFFQLKMVMNRGVSFGLLPADSEFGRWLLMGFSGFIAVLLGGWLVRGPRPLVAAALGCVVGGAIGNLIDRARFGAVVDFLDFSGLYFPWVFNVADAAISIGVGFLLLDMFVEGKRTKA